MIYEEVNLLEKYVGLAGSSIAKLTAYIHGVSGEIDLNEKRPAVLICPGGGYAMTSDREAEPVALKFLAAGFNVFVLRYSVLPVRYPAQLLEVSAAVDYIRKMSNTWHIDVDKIAVGGFSAGGHLAGSLGVLWNDEFIYQTLNIGKGANKPNALILAYPVITSGEFAHMGSFENLLGDKQTTQLLTKLSLENLVSSDTPPTFLWHTFDDGCVPVENTLLFATALKQNKIPFELHIYPSGVHGLSLCDKDTAYAGMSEHINPHVSSWFDLCVKWLNFTFNTSSI